MRTSLTFIIAFVLYIFSAGYGLAQMDEENCHQTEVGMSSMTQTSCCSMGSTLCSECAGVISGSDAAGHGCCNLVSCKAVSISSDIATGPSGLVVKEPHQLSDTLYLLSALDGSGDLFFTGLSPPGRGDVPLYLQNCSFLI